MVKAIDILSASLGIDFERDPLSKITSRMAEEGVSVFRMNFGHAFVCICFEPEAIKTLNAAVESINRDLEKRI